MDTEKRNQLGLLILFWFFWIMVTGSVQIIPLIVGALVSLMVLLFNRSILIQPEERSPVTGSNLLIYFKLALRFLRDIFIANIQVALIVLNPRLPVEPRIVTFRSGLKTQVNRVLLANTITLTPGTLSVMCSEDEYVVHALSPRHGEDVKNMQLTADLRETET